MVSQGKNNDLPDKDTLRRYLQGKLPPDEAYRIEKLILNNPLYQDALDGLETLSEEELEQDLTDLSHQIREKTQTASKGTKINFYRIAAAVLVLAVFSYIIIYTTSRVGEVSKNETLPFLTGSISTLSLSNVLGILISIFLAFTFTFSEGSGGVSVKFPLWST